MIRLTNDMSLDDLLPVATKLFYREIALSPAEINMLLDLMRLRAEENLRTGEQLRGGCVLVEKRIDGTVKVLFSEYYDVARRAH